LNGYASVERAVIAASNRYNPDSIKRNREHVGAIVACAGALFYTHGKGRPGVTPIRFSIMVPDGCALEALWHTHGGRGRHRRYFSPSGMTRCRHSARVESTNRSAKAFNFAVDCG
jgi:hypothetical protein